MRTMWLLGVTLTVSIAPAPALSQQLLGLPHDVHVGPGDQSDPHVSGSLVAYTSAIDGASEIRIHNLEDGRDEAIPTGGALDLLSDISGTTIAFTRLGSDASSIMSHDVASPGPPFEVAPVPNANRRRAVLGGPTIAWLDHGLAGAAGLPVLAAVTGGEGVATRLSDDLRIHREPAVSPDGQVVVWTRCEQDGRGCAVIEARRSGGTWITEVRAALGESSHPDTNGELVVYAAERTEGGARTRDIYWQPIAGGPERRLQLEGDDANPSVSGRYIAFERHDPARGGAADIVLYDLDAAWLYQLTDTPEGESLNDVSVTDEGVVQVVWTVPGADGLDVKGMTLRLPDVGTCIPMPTSCDDPFNRVLLAELSLDRSCGPREHREVDFVSGHAGEGLVCVTLGSGGREVTSAWIQVDGDAVLTPRDFKRGLTHWERTVSMRAGAGRLSATLGGAPGGGLEIALYGPPTCPQHQPVQRSPLADRDGALQPVPGRPLFVTDGLASTSLLRPGGETAMEGGCSASGAGAVAWALLLLALALRTARPRTLVRLRVRLPRR